MDPVSAINVQSALHCRLILTIDCILHLGNGFAGQSCLVDHGASSKQDTIARDHVDCCHTQAVRRHPRHLPFDRDQIPRQQVHSAELHPLLLAVNLHYVRLGGHAAEHPQGAEALEGRGRLEQNNGEEGEEGVLPVLVQQPEHGGEQLEHGDGAQQLGLQQVQEARLRHRQPVDAEPLLPGLHLLRLQPLGLPVLRQNQVHGVRHRQHGPVVGSGPHHLLFPQLLGLGHGDELVDLPLELEREAPRALRSVHFGHGGQASVGRGLDHHPAAGGQLAGGGVEGRGLEPDHPMAHQVEQGVERDRQEQRHAGPCAWQPRVRERRRLFFIRIRCVGAVGGVGRGRGLPLGRRSLGVRVGVNVVRGHRVLILIPRVRFGGTSLVIDVRHTAVSVFVNVGHGLVLRIHQPSQMADSRRGHQPTLLLRNGGIRLARLNPVNLEQRCLVRVTHGVIHISTHNCVHHDQSQQHG
mmetsp:Transcript_1812/g.2994  ORF Transcript_1812/g.2994 Transcript_1812/m.2994 type:complete len:466 (+) Transcript_1812:4595-5992(+)